MTHVSKNDLPRAVRQEIDRQFLHLSSGNEAKANFFEELLTDTERLMLAKRLATIFMLIEEQSYYRIEQVLGVSVSTSKRLHQLLIGGAFTSIERLAARKKEREKILANIDLIMRAGLPPRAYVIKRKIYLKRQI